MQAEPVSSIKLHLVRKFGKCKDTDKFPILLWKYVLILLRLTSLQNSHPENLRVSGINWHFIDQMDQMDDFIFSDNAESPLGPLGPSGPFKTLYAGAIPVFFNSVFRFFCFSAEFCHKPSMNPFFCLFSGAVGDTDLRWTRWTRWTFLRYCPLKIESSIRSILVHWVHEMHFFAFQARSNV